MTLFAPTDVALGGALLGFGFSSPRDVDPQVLTGVLMYHVVTGRVKSTDLSSGTVPTLSGEDVCIKVGDTANVSGATVGPADILAANVVVHVVDQGTLYRVQSCFTAS